MQIRLAQLRIKIRSLVDEARNIRREENRALGRRAVREITEATGPFKNKKLNFEWVRRGTPDLVLYRDLRGHRRGTRERPGIVRSVARISLLAYAMIRNVPYLRAESAARTPPNWAEVRKVAERFGAVQDRAGGETAAQFKERLATQAAAFDLWLVNATAKPASSGQCCATIAPPEPMVAAS